MIVLGLTLAELTGKSPYFAVIDQHAHSRRRFLHSASNFCFSDGFTLTDRFINNDNDHHSDMKLLHLILLVLQRLVFSYLLIILRQHRKQRRTLDPIIEFSSRALVALNRLHACARSPHLIPPSEHIVMHIELLRFSGLRRES